MGNLAKRNMFQNTLARSLCSEAKTRHKYTQISDLLNCHVSSMFTLLVLNMWTLCQDVSFVWKILASWSSFNSTVACRRSGQPLWPEKHLPAQLIFSILPGCHILVVRHRVDLLSKATCYSLGLTWTITFWLTSSRLMHTLCQ